MSTATATNLATYNLTVNLVNGEPQEHRDVKMYQVGEGSLMITFSETEAVLIPLVHIASVEIKQNPSS